jgi:hypothetical protein
MAKLPASNVFAKKVRKAKDAARRVSVYGSKRAPRQDKGIKRGPRSLEQKAQSAALRAIDKSNKAEIARLGPVTPEMLAAITEGLKKRHCDLCSNECPGCNKPWTACAIPHTCGYPDHDQFWNPECILLCHVRRPCLQTPEEQHKVQWAAWNAADAAEAAVLAAH